MRSLANPFLPAWKGQVMKRFLQQLFRQFGLEIRRRQGRARTHLGPDRDSLDGVLRQINEAGFVPATVIDVGAALGMFTRTCHAVFPHAGYLLIEPLQEYLPSLTTVSRDIPQTQFTLAAATATGDSAILNVHPDMVGSSLYRETEVGTDVNGTPRQVHAIKLDQWIKEQGGMSPYLIKIDVQGAELDVLEGGQATLSDTEVVILEVSLFRFFQQGPVFHDVLDYMRARGFVPYDFLGPQYRPIDDALAQIDVVFVKEEGMLRRIHSYATPEQRRRQNQRFRSSVLSGVSNELSCTHRP
jgi:FkbM family methyltransferase